MQNDVRKVTYGASVVALVGVFLWINRYTSGMLEGYFTFLLPLPLILFAGKYGLKASLTPLIAILLITVLFLMGTPSTVFFTVNGCLTGMAYGWGIYSKKSGNQLLLITMFFTFISYFVTTYVFADIFGINIQEEINFVMTAFKDMPTNLPLGLSMADILQALYPAVLAISAFLEAFIVHTLAFLILKRLRYPMEHLTSLVTFRIPKWVGLILLILTFSSFIIPRLNDPQWASVILVISTISTVLFFVDGLFFLAWYIRSFGKKSDMLYFYVLLVVTGLFLTAIMVGALVFFGMLDMCTDFKNWLLRRRNNAE